MADGQSLNLTDKKTEYIKQYFTPPSYIMSKKLKIGDHVYHQGYLGVVVNEKHDIGIVLLALPKVGWLGNDLRNLRKETFEILFKQFKFWWVPTQNVTITSKSYQI